jgi:hypothetical protein
MNTRSRTRLRGVRFPDPDDEDEYEDQEVSQQIEVMVEDEADEDVFGGASRQVPF